MPQITRDNVRECFTYHKPDAVRAAKHESVNEQTAARFLFTSKTIASDIPDLGIPVVHLEGLPQLIGNKIESPNLLIAYPEDDDIAELTICSLLREHATDIPTADEGDLGPGHGGFLSCGSVSFVSNETFS